MKIHSHVIGKQDELENTAGHIPQTTGSLIRWAHSYDGWVQIMTLGRAAAIRRRTAELAQISPGNRVLDVGCGTGDLTIEAKVRAGSAGEVTGIDASPEMVNTARQKVAHTAVNINFQNALIEDIPFPDNYFDVALSSLMMHHLPAELKDRGIAEIYRVLKPGGTVLIMDMKGPSSFMSRVLLTLLFHGGMQAGLEQLAPKLTQAGFTNLTTGRMNLPILGFIRAQTAE